MILSPNNSVAFLDQVELELDHTFQTKVILGGLINSNGEYLIKAQYGDSHRVDRTKFSFINIAEKKDISNTPPEIIADNKVDENNFQSSLEFVPHAITFEIEFIGGIIGGGIFITIIFIYFKSKKNKINKKLKKIPKKKSLSEELADEERMMWTCSHCRPPRKFAERSEYIDHHSRMH